MDTSLNPRLAAVSPSPTARIMERARELKRAGKDIVDLAGGEPDMPPPEAGREAGIERIRSGNLSYGPIPGSLELRTAIAERIAHRQGIACDAASIIVGTGSKQVLFEALFAATTPGDEVIIPSPHWVSYPAMVALAGGNAKIVATTSKTGFKLTPSQLADALTSRTRWLILNSPSNPTGAVYRKSELAALAEVIRSHPRIMVLSDDIYEDICYDGIEVTTIGTLGSDLLERSVSCSGFSKSFAMTGLRVGYARAPTWLRNSMMAVQSHVTNGGCVVAQAIAEGSLSAAPEFPSESCEIYARRRARGLAILAQTNQLEITPPDGAFYFWIGVESLLGSKSPQGHHLALDSDLSAALLLEVGLAVMPGSAFGAPGYLRMSFAAKDDVVAEGCTRLVKFAQDCRHG